MVEHLIPENLNEALKYLYKGSYQVFAGGTDLMVQNRTWAEVAVPFAKNMLFCAHLPELKGITRVNDRLVIGSMTTLEEILNHPEVPSLLKKAIGEMASPGIRHVATLGGNIGNASPAGDTLPVLIVLDSWVELRSMASSRMILIKDLVIGVKKTSMHPEEMIISVNIPLHTFTKEMYVKVGGRKADAISKVSFVGVCDIEDGRISDLRVAFGAVGKTVIRDESVEGAWEQVPIEELKTHFWRLEKMVDPLIQPIDDQRSTKVYRKKVALNLLRDFVNQLS